MAIPKGKANPETVVKRFLYLCSEDSRFVTGNPDVYKYYSVERAKAVTELIEANKIDTILNIIAIVNSENTLPRRATLFFVLAILTRTKAKIPDALRTQIYTIALNTLKSTEDFFLFIRFCTLQKKSFSSGLNRLIHDFYLKKEPKELLEEVTKRNGLHTWTHKDLFKLSHCKTNDKLIDLIMVYVLFGLEAAEKMSSEIPEAEDFISHFKKITELKRCEDENRIAELITELGCSLSRVPSLFHNSQVVWEALLPNLSLKELIRSLPKLYKLGFLKANTPFQTKVVEALTNANNIKSSKIHPVEVFVGLRNFEKGGKPLDPRFLDYMEKKAEEKKATCPNYVKPVLIADAPKCPAIISALHKAMQVSFHNPQPLARKIMITFDTTEKMKESCLHCKNLSCLDAATIMTLSLLRAEKDVTVAVFNDNNPVKIISFEKNITLNQALSKLKECKCKYVLPSSSIEWALNAKKHIDLFINFVYRSFCSGVPKELQQKQKQLGVFSTYRKKMSLTNSKLITFSLSSHRSTGTHNIQNTLDICGFSEEVPKVVEAFSKGLFN